MRIHRTLHDTTELPHTYREYRTVDFKQDGKLIVAVKVVFASISLVAVGVALLLALPLETAWPGILTILVTVFACLVYMAAHEATHGTVLQLRAKVRPSYDIRFHFLMTGSHAYLTRRSAVVVALAPSVIWALCWLLHC